jgi:hypothetical protein
MVLDNVKSPLASVPARALVVILTFSLLLVGGGCSGTKGRNVSPGTPRAAEPCATPDQGTVDLSSASYYQIGTCPVDESEGAKVNQDE